MTKIEGITDAPNQDMSVILEDGTRVEINLRYKPNQSGWFVDVIRGEWAARGLRLVASPNMLRQWKNVIPFGLGVYTLNQREPMLLDSFTTTTKLLLLTEADVAAQETEIFAAP